MRPFGELFEWRWVFGTQLGNRTQWLLVGVALAAVLLSGVSLVRERKRGKIAHLFALRSTAVLLCLFVALQPRLEFGQVTRIPNQVAVLVDASRSMSVAPPHRGPTRAERAFALIQGAKERMAAWGTQGHPVSFYTFGESLASTTRDGLAKPPEGEGTLIAETLYELHERLAGRDLGAVIILSDGIDTGRMGSSFLDEQVKKTISALNVPIHTIAFTEKDLRDLSIATVLADDFSFVRSPIKLEAVVRHSNLGGRMVEVTLLREGQVQDAKMIQLRDGVSEERVVFTVTPDRPGEFIYEIKTPVLLGEALATNNRQVFTLKVMRDRVRILHVCGRPSWDQRFLRSLLRLNPNVDLVSFFILRTDSDDRPFDEKELSLIPFPHHEIFDEQLKTFDLLVFHNFNFKPYMVEPYLPGVKRYVEEGGALAMIGGELSFASGHYGQSALADVLPVNLTGIPAEGSLSVSVDAFRPRLTREGKVHPVTAISLNETENLDRWKSLPMLTGINRVAGLQPGAISLLAHPNHRSGDGKAAPVLAVREVGRGRTLALLTDTAWHWAFASAGSGQDDRVFQRFWEGAIRWLVRDPALSLLRIELKRPEFDRGLVVTGRARAVHADFSPARDVALSLDLHRVEEAGKTLQSQKLMTGAEGETPVELGVLAPGAYRLVGRAQIDGRAVETQTTFVVRAEGRELEDVVARPQVLAALARESGGQHREEAFDDFAIRPPRTVRVGSARSVEIWSHPLLLVLIVGILSTEWVLRRRGGHG